MASLRPESTSRLERGSVSAPAVTINDRETSTSLPSRPTSLTWAIWLAFAAAAWNNILGTSTIAFIGSYNFTVAEPVMAAGAMALLIDSRRYGLRGTAFTVAVALFAVLTGLNFIRGLEENFTRALVVARSTLPFSILLLLGTISYPATMVRENFTRSVTWISLLLAVVLYARLVLGPQFLMIGGSSLNVAEINDGGRPLAAQGAFLIATAAVIHMSAAVRRSEPKNRSALLATFFFVTVILSGQGTASIAAVIGIVLVLSLEQGPSAGLRLLTGSAVAVFTVVLMIGFRSFNPADWAGILPPGLLDNLSRRTGNLGTREMVWQAAWSAYLQGSPFNQILGWPTASLPQLIVVERSWGHVVWQANVHSMYLGTLLNQGALGMFAFIAALFAATYTSISQLVRRYGASPIALVVMIAIFGYSYSLSVEQSLILVAAIIPVGNAAANKTLNRRTPYRANTFG